MKFVIYSEATKAAIMKSHKGKRLSTKDREAIEADLDEIAQHEHALQITLEADDNLKPKRSNQ
jgi:hypothetical protein